MNPFPRRMLVSGESLAMMAAIAGMTAIPAMTSRSPRAPKKAASNKAATGQPGSKLRKLADKGGIGIRKHW